MHSKLALAFWASILATGAFALPQPVPEVNSLETRSNEAKADKNGAQYNPTVINPHEGDPNYQTFNPKDLGPGVSYVHLGPGDWQAEDCKRNGCSNSNSFCPCDDRNDPLRRPIDWDQPQRGPHFGKTPPGHGPGPVVGILPHNGRSYIDSDGWTHNPSAGCGDTNNPCPYYPLDLNNYESGRGNHR